MKPEADFRYRPTPKLDGATILVTGATGSFGKAFVKRVLECYRPAKLIVFSRDELKQLEMQQDPVFDGHPALRYFIGDVRDCDRLEMALRGVDYVVHAAALKQVPTAEYNPFECIATNVHGAEHVVRASLRAGVRKVVALSTDKAVSPVNLYGASKLAADKIFVAANNLSGADGPQFSVVRYGNVLGSRGSVVPLFLKLKREGAARLPVTDARMTRFWITLLQGVDFVLSSLALMEGGEIFVPKIPSMRIVDLAETILPGRAPQFIGIRPGEKIHETLITADDARATVELADRYVILPPGESDGVPRRFAAARKVPEDFFYASQTNEAWLDAKALHTLLADGGLLDAEGRAA